MTKIRFIGDTHGKLLEYLKIIEDCQFSIQVGDFGMGFGTRGKAEFVDSQIAQMYGTHVFIRGNHDDPSECRNSKYWIEDGHCVKRVSSFGNMMFVGGAWSIDWMFRKEGVSWWRDEELSIAELNNIQGVYEQMKPRVMVTHTAPKSICPLLVRKIFEPDHMRTEDALQAMLDFHRPDIWIFGHWHTSFDQVIDGTRFVCLNELEWKDIEV